MKVAAIALTVVALTGSAQARDWSSLMARIGGTAWLHYELTELHEVDADARPSQAQAPSMRDLVLAGARLHGIVGTGFPILYHAGLDLAAGATLRGGGFAYDVALFPVGAAVRLGQTSMLALGAGIGAMGATSALDDAMTFPIELTAEGGGAVRVLARLRTTYVAAAKRRHDGSSSAPLGDELDAMLGVRIGHHYHDYGFPSGNGYFIAASYRELERGRFFGVTIGYSIDVSSREAASD